MEAHLRIIMLGKTGVGKSSTANTILGENLFTTSCLANSDTATCKAATNTVDGRKITVVDTPGCFSTECPDEKLKPEITRCIVECSPGPHAFLIVLPVRRYTEEEKKAVDEIVKMFGKEALKYAVVLFTNGAQLDNNVTIRKFVDENDHLKTLVQKCGNRFHVIDNKHWSNPTEGPDDERSNAVQIKKLLNTIDQMVKQNGGKHYTNEMLQAVAQAIEEEMAEGKTRVKAKESVMILLAGVTAGTLCGALLGTAAGSAVINIAKAIKSGDTEAIALAGVQTVTMLTSQLGKKLAVGPGLAEGLSVGAGAIAGGIIGASAVSEAETVEEGVKRAISAVTGAAKGGRSGDLRIVLLGKTGAGKSSTANSILGKNLLRTSCRANSDTATCEAATNTVDGRKITVVDTPGYFSTECTDENLKPEISKCIVECSPGPHAFLIMLPVTRYTEEENKTVAEILKMFGEEALKYAVVLFTHGDQLDDGMTIQQFVDSNDHLKTLVQKCGNRLHVIDNKYWKNPSEGHDDERCNAVQIKKLLSTIDEMVQQNGGKHYTNEMLQAVEQAIKEEMAEGKTREKAKQSVMKMILIVIAKISR
ncbi:uncharacterized protein LOC118214021 [Anguilla anguilla]|uniref:uncharacterized protein LOC118214021 n=1 Tax=Anguilla anguilla TaxID=7936 RepID=UPI0015AC5206|nr:uncharacterized protein LOC118214021 [Anguilla anguilla]